VTRLSYILGDIVLGAVLVQKIVQISSKQALFFPLFQSNVKNDPIFLINLCWVIFLGAPLGAFFFGHTVHVCLR
jgi:hypothetical protein